MNQPTDVQLKRFWEWCGFQPRYGGLIGQEHIIGWHYPNRDTHLKTPELTLNNLFKYAVPKLRYALLQWSGQEWTAEVQYPPFTGFIPAGSDPSLALFWAVNEIIEEGTK